MFPASFSTFHFPAERLIALDYQRLQRRNARDFFRWISVPGDALRGFRFGDVPDYLEFEIVPGVQSDLNIFISHIVTQYFHIPFYAFFFM